MADIDRTALVGIDTPVPDQALQFTDAPRRGSRLN